VEQPAAMKVSGIPSRPGTVVFTGGGWLRRQLTGPQRERSGDDVLILSDPCRVLVAQTAGEVPTLLDEIAAEQARGRCVAGYVAYEAGAAFGLTVKTKDPLPLAWMAAYPGESARRLSGYERDCLLGTVDPAWAARLSAAIQPELSVSREEFVRAIGSIRELIAAGDTYQVNYTVRARFDLDIDPTLYFLALVLRQPVPYAAFFDLGETQILSLSPELFLRRHGTYVESMPMKGTRPRADDPAEDAAFARELIRSEKDRAENLMIVDMVRNDLGRVSRAGSIRVPALFAVEPYRTVWQMTSTVTGKVRRGATVSEIMAATFPGASITGAPKHHTMEIIARLETEPRGAYTGTVGLFLPGGDFTCNLAIRTLVHERGSFRLGVGAGIVWDSDPDEEYQETLTKATFALPRTGSRWEPLPISERVHAGSIGLFETILLDAGAVAAGADGEVPGQGAAEGVAPLIRYRYLHEHLERMAASAVLLGLSFDRTAAQRELAELAGGTSESLVVRLELDLQGKLRLTTRPIPERVSAPVTLMVSPFRTDPHDPLLAHKTTARHLYDSERERAQAIGCQEALFLNSLGHITEGAITNLFARFGESWVTPPVEDGLLPGVWRADFLRRKSAEERSLGLDELLLADEIVVGNSVRGEMRVDTVAGNSLEGISL
jgi:para-aminobenzoate synthetase/4-amino-4-deoxychorismate lyase